MNVTPEATLLELELQPAQVIAETKIAHHSKVLEEVERAWEMERNTE